MERIPPGRYIAFFAIAAAGCALDLWTKHAMFAWPLLRQGGEYWLIDGYAGLQLSLNEGALFGLGQGGQLWFALLSVLAALAIPVWLFVYRAAQDRWMNLTLAAVMGGVLGNLYDRAGMHGLAWGVDWPLYGDRAKGEPVYAVRDWILLQASDAWRWPNFNIADSLLVVGAAILFVRALRQPGDSHATPQPVAEDSD